MTEKERFTIEPTAAGIEQLHKQVTILSISWDISRKQSREINLILEEICVNVINHGVKKEGKIIITLSLEDSMLIMTVTDNGQPFDLTAAAAPDVGLPVEKREAGGLGIYLVKHYSDSIVYKRTDGNNILTIEKNLHQEME